MENLQLKVEAENREKVAAQQALGLAESREAALHERLRQQEKQCEAQEKKQAEQEEALRSKVRELEHALQTTRKAVRRKHA